MRVIRAVIAGAAVTAVVTCGEPVGAPLPLPTVVFVLDPPPCSSVIPVEFQIDDVRVGVDTFRVSLDTNHVRSEAFTTTIGQHVLFARVPQGEVWPKKTVTLSAGQQFAFVLRYYCT